MATAKPHESAAPTDATEVSDDELEDVTGGNAAWDNFAGGVERAGEYIKDFFTGNF
jgi:hypothetical protein